MRQVVAKDHKKTHVQTKTHHLYTNTHISMYVSKANIFILLTSANYGPIYLIDFTNM